MTMKDHSLLQAANLRVSYAENNIESMVTQVSNIISIEEARDLIIALTMTGNTPVDTLRKALSNSM